MMNNFNLLSIIIQLSIIIPSSFSKEKAGQRGEEGYLITYEQCIYLYTRGGNLKIYYVKPDDLSLEMKFELPIPPKPTSFEGRCIEYDEQEKQVKPAKLTLNWTDLKDNGELELTFIIKYTQSKRWWRVSQLTAGIKYKDINERVNLDPQPIESASDFSFSCSDLVTDSQYNSTDLDDLQQFTRSYYFELIFDRFQLQPFKSRNNKVFADSFDCSTFFTIPIWMGLFVILMMIAIVFVGVYFLSEIHTMDRFENPKGKTITITATD